jgi:hypothetical protein
MGEIRKRGGVYWIRYYRDGRRHEESARTDKWETARDLLRDREGDIAKGLPVSPKTGKLTFDDAADDLLTDYETTKRNRSNTPNVASKRRSRRGSVDAAWPTSPQRRSGSTC